jgi:hypothetical protein
MRNCASEVWCCGPSRNDGYGFTGCLKIEFYTILWVRTRATLSLVVAREGGRSSIPETLAIAPRGRGVLDRPVKPDDDFFLWRIETTKSTLGMGGSIVK